MKFIISLEVISRFREYYHKKSSWGSLHVVLDDGNVGFDAVQCCLRTSKNTQDLEGEILSEYLLFMSKTQRMKMYKGGYFKNDSYQSKKHKE